VAEVLLEFPTLVVGEDGRRYIARACGSENDGGGMWQGWIEFVPVDGSPPVRSRRETTQPNREAAEYWATGLTPVYLEGSLRRALSPLTPRVMAHEAKPAFDGPAPDFEVDEPPAAKPRESILNPFSVYQKGEDLLRRQLAALSAWHLVNIAEAYDLVDDRINASSLEQSALIELIVAGVKRRREPARTNG
jgi:hypothetical protein